MKSEKAADPVTALDTLFELTARLGELMQRELGERGLSPARAEALMVLHQGGPMVQRQLSETLRCTPRHVTTLVDALEAEGWVVRRPHPTDRRATLVVLTDEGATEAARMDAGRHEAARTLFGDVPQARLATFVWVATQVLERAGGSPATSAEMLADVNDSEERERRTARGGQARRRTPDRPSSPSRHKEEE